MTDARHLDLDLLRRVVAEQPHPLVFAAVSGAHLYGFASVDSDVDLRGVHLLALRDVVGLRTGPETLEVTADREGVELDLVTHDLAKFARLLLRPNGYVLEQLTSPLVVATSPVHEELLALVPGLVTRGHARHYLGFARTQWRLVETDDRLKPLLYLVRVLLTGVHLMRTGEVQAHLPTLVDVVPEAPAWVGDAVAAKAEAEHAGRGDVVGPLEQLEAERDRLVEVLRRAEASSTLPEGPSAEAAVDALLVRERLATGTGSTVGPPC